MTRKAKKAEKPRRMERKRSQRQAGNPASKQTMERSHEYSKPAETMRAFRAPQQPHMRMGSKVGAVRAIVGREAETNAASYASVLAMPFEGMQNDTRIPDLLTWPSGTAVLYEERTFPVNPPGPTGDYSGRVQFVFSPSLTTSTLPPEAGLNGFLSIRCSQEDAQYRPWNNPSWTSVHATAAANSMFSYRTVAFGVEVIPETVLSDRSGAVTTSLWWDPHTLTTAFGEIGSLVGARCVSAASDDVSGLQQIWRPGDYVEALDYRSTPSRTNKGCLIFQFENHTKAQTYRFRIVHHVEYLPRPSVSPFVEQKSASGDEGSTARAVEAVLRTVGDVASATTYTAREVARFAPQIGRAISQVTRVGSLIAGYASGLMAASSASPVSGLRQLHALHKRHGRGGDEREFDAYVERLIREEEAIEKLRATLDQGLPPSPATAEHHDSRFVMIPGYAPGKR